ncbi:MAG: hypothetical protein DMF97_21245 [Acidobacteria bacterium]|nr:MAG: hypothetical protein DMF97_21245 [Acidobacteriota bacterium]
MISNRTAPSRTGERRRDCSIGRIPAHA